MNNTVILYLNLCCEAEIKLKDYLNNQRNWSLHNAPCFGRFFHADNISGHRDKTVTDINITVYQFTDYRMLKDFHENNYCSLLPEDLAIYHAELEKVFSNYTPTEKTNLVITRKDTTRCYDNDNCRTPEKFPAVAIHIRADKMTVYQVMCLLTLIRLTSEYPNALLMREVVNLRKTNISIYRKFSILSLFMLLTNRLHYVYDQGPINSFDTRKALIRPMCLDFFANRMTNNTPQMQSTQLRVQNCFEIVPRSLRNMRTIELPYYTAMGRINDNYNSGLYRTNEVIEGILFKNDIDHDALASYEQLLNAVLAQFPRLKLDYPDA